MEEICIKAFPKPVGECRGLFAKGRGALTLVRCAVQVIGDVTLSVA